MVPSGESCRSRGGLAIGELQLRQRVRLPCPRLLLLFRSMRVCSISFALGLEELLAVGVAVIAFAGCSRSVRQLALSSGTRNRFVSRVEGAADSRRAHWDSPGRGVRVI